MVKLPDDVRDRAARTTLEEQVNAQIKQDLLRERVDSLRKSMLQVAYGGPLKAQTRVAKQALAEDDRIAASALPGRNALDTEALAEHGDRKSYAESPAKSTVHVSQEGTRLTNLEKAVEQLQGLHDETRSEAAKALVAENEQLKARVADGWQRRQDAWTRTANLMRERDAAQREGAEHKVRVAELEVELEKELNKTFVLEAKIEVARRTQVERDQLKARVAELERLRDTPIPSLGAAKWRKYRELVAELAKWNPFWDRGIVAYNAAFRVDPVLVRTITDAARDPFNDDSRIPAFEAALRKAWGVPEEPSPGAVKWRRYREQLMEIAKKRPHLRPGQVAYHAAYGVDIELVSTFNGTARDPYYDDSRIPAFEAALRAGWNVPEGEA